MKLVKQADVILALGTRLNPFSTLPQHDIEYWTGNAKIIQVDANPDMLGLAKHIDIGICGDARAVSEQLLEALGNHSAGSAGEARKAQIATEKSAWLQKLTGWDNEEDDPGSTWNARAREAEPEKMVGQRRGRSRQHLECPCPGGRAGEDGAAPGLARDSGRFAAQRHGVHRYRQHLRHGQQLPAVRRAPQLPGAGHVR
jgi:hypothetical protein